MEILCWLIGIAIMAVICSLIMYYDEYREDRDKNKWHKNIARSLLNGVIAFFLPVAIIIVIAIGANKET